MVSLYVTRLSIKTKSTDIEEYLAHRFPEIKAVEMTSRYPEAYKSFKVTLNRDSLDAVMSPEVWPEGARVDRFFHWRMKGERAA